MERVAFDQAIFTSASRAGGEGYRIIAASAGIDSAARRSIQQTAPSHGSLAPDDEAAVAVSFFRLPDNRYCVGHSIHAGLEQTGRGGRRVYTHFLVTDAVGLCRFRMNPFHLLRIAAKDGVLAPNIKAAGTLDAVHLIPEPDRTANDSMQAALRAVDPTRLRRLFERMLSETRVALSCPPEIAATVGETLLVSLPMPRRAEVSLAVGLKFSLTRKVSLTIVDPTGAPVARRLRGTGVERFDVAGDPADPVPGSWPWAELAETLWRENETDTLITMSADVPFDATIDIVNGLADLGLATKAVTRCDRRELLTLAGRRATMPAAESTERRWRDHFWMQAARRMATLWCAPADAPTPNEWQAVAEWAQNDATVAGHLAVPVSAMLRHHADLDPVAAVKAGLTLARLGEDAWRQVLNHCEEHLIERLIATSRDKPGDPVSPDRLKLLQDWQRIAPQGNAAERALSERLSPSEATVERVG